MLLWVGGITFGIRHKIRNVKFIEMIRKLVPKRKFSLSAFKIIHFMHATRQAETLSHKQMLNSARYCNFNQN